MLLNQLRLPTTRARSAALSTAARTLWYMSASPLRVPPVFQYINRSLSTEDRSTDTPATPCFEASPILSTAWPRLKEAFAAKTNDDDQYPLFTDKQLKFFEQTKKPEIIETTPSHQQRQAAVLLLLCSVDGQPAVLFTKRAAHMPLHGGEVSFPGGHFDAVADDSLEQTALRETLEELQPTDPSLLCHPRLTVLGPTTGIPSLKGTPVQPYIAVLWPDFSTADIETYFPGDPREVERVFCVSVADLKDLETNHELPKNRFGVVRAPCYPVPDQGNVWGLTAYITKPILHGLLLPVFGEE